MTRDDIIKLAREAGISDGAFDFQMVSMDDLKHFAALVEAAERERIAAEFDRRAMYSDGTPSSGWYEPHEPAEIVRSGA